MQSRMGQIRRAAPRAAFLFLVEPRELPPRARAAVSARYIGSSVRNGCWNIPTYSREDAWSSPIATTKTKKPPRGRFFCIWWSWRELNPRPRALYLRHYMLSSPLILVCRKHDVRSAPAATPAKFRHRLAGRRRCRFRDNDLTSTSTGTSGFRAYALSGESVVVVVGN